VQVAYVQKSVFAGSEIYESRLNRRLDIYHFAFIYIADVAGCRSSLYIKLFEAAILNDRDSALVRLGKIYKHLS
jgi:hypothetical protein